MTCLPLPSRLARKRSSPRPAFAYVRTNHKFVLARCHRVSFCLMGCSSGHKRHGVCHPILLINIKRAVDILCFDSHHHTVVLGTHHPWVKICLQRVQALLVTVDFARQNTGGMLPRDFQVSLKFSGGSSRNTCNSWPVCCSYVLVFEFRCSACTCRCCQMRAEQHGMAWPCPSSIFEANFMNSSVDSCGLVSSGKPHTAGFEGC